MADLHLRFQKPESSAEVVVLLPAMKLCSFTRFTVLDAFSHQCLKEFIFREKVIFHDFKSYLFVLLTFPQSQKALNYFANQRDLLFNFHLIVKSLFAN